MALGGYAHHVGCITLSTGKITYEDIPEEWAHKYIGARGLGVKYCLEAGPIVDPLSPANLLCFLNGPLTGTCTNMNGRMAIVEKQRRRFARTASAGNSRWCVECQGFQ